MVDRELLIRLGTELFFQALLEREKLELGNISSEDARMLNDIRDYFIWQCIMRQ
jgi:hypothetical protein